MGIAPTLVSTIPVQPTRPTDATSVAPDQLQATPAGSPEAEAFRASQAEPAPETRVAMARDNHPLFPDVANRIDQLSSEMNSWFKATGMEGMPLPDSSAANPQAQMRELFEFASKQYVNNAMLSMKLNVTNQEMEAVNKDKDQLIRGGS